ncbi:Putative phosphonates utilization ATP-binding protein PhnK [Jeotgalicoccus saudimassiliensis]|uniref:Putative phosphonates utilization ATP-binding protein PhnK n=1 Tax=Jeotgalicoccus saudimassiliensis TaxID=1461582 RepID=A0A078MDL7_9STAP|nr:ATP-binding cassette domain-containing protein [Jeotgalicoccus saudimassiliensis]CEA03547.1 Putative phosphonates utilization ATP-binding protein PhnK [Jeotgalicoccus saudimassiliensis]
MPAIDDVVLSIRDLSKQFGSGCEYCKDENFKLQKNMCPHCHTVYAVRNTSFDLYKGEILGIVGESGSGKSTLMKMLYFDQDATSGNYILPEDGTVEGNVFNVSSQKKRQIRNEQLGMVYQNPILGLKMDFSSVTNIAEKLIASGNRNVGEMTDRGDHFLGKVKIALSRKYEAPKNFSGGMQQRVQIAKALSNYPPILLLDEVTTGLDLSVQADVLELIKEIQRDMGVSMIVVSHDLAIIRMLCDRTMVMLDGEVIEHGITDQILEDPQHKYTQQLVYSIL